MADAVFVTLTLLFFTLSWGFLHMAERMRGGG